MPLIIRPETPSDIPAIREVLQASFPLPLESLLVDNLRSKGNLTLSLVAESQGQIVGHIALSPVTVKGGALTGGLGLAPLAVLPAFQKQGIGSSLVRQAIALAKAGGHHPFIVLLGEPAYYHRFGFIPARLHALIDEYEGADAFQVLELTSNTLGRPQPGQAPSLVQYAPEFSIFAP